MTIDADACWRWTGHVRKDGRPVASRRYVYRLIYESATGESLPTHVVLHHTCENPWCVNPFHLSPQASQSAHMKEHGAGGDWGQAEKTHCTNGHPYSAENTYVYQRIRDGIPTTERHCRECTRASKRRHYARKKAQR